jgi:hypothetical protein
MYVAMHWVQLQLADGLHLVLRVEKMSQSQSDRPMGLRRRPTNCARCFHHALNVTRDIHCEHHASKVQQAPRTASSTHTPSNALFRTPLTPLCQPQRVIAEQPHDSYSTWLHARRLIERNWQVLQQWRQSPPGLCAYTRMQMPTALV